MNLDTINIWIGAIVTICCFSFLLKDNPLYRFVEHLFVGVSAGYYLSTVAFHQFLKPNVFAKIMPKTFGIMNQAPEYILIIPLILGLMMLFRFSAKLSWVSRYTVAFVMGVSTGITVVTSVEQYLIPQFLKAVVPLFVQNNIGQSLSNMVLVIGTIACLFYFFFSKEHKGPLYGNVAKVGILFLMISFGASFGATVMGRVSLLIGRFQFLLHDWLGAI